MSNMSTQIKITLAVSAIGFAMSQGALADSVTFQQIDGHFENASLTAGEYTALGTPFVDNYAASATATYNGQTGFQTFCLELDEDMRLDREFDYTMAMSATEGGVGGPNPDPLSLGSAWLYSEFAAGTLTGYDYTVGVGREQSATELQDAFWWLEEELAMDNPNDNIYLAAAFAQLGDESAAKGDSGGAYNVSIMNPITANSVHLQSVMVVGPVNQVPDGGLTLGLLGFSLAGIARLRKRFSTSG